MTVCKIWNDGFRGVIRNAVLDLRSSLSLTAEKTDIFFYALNGLYNYVTSPEPRNEVVNYKVETVYRKRSKTFTTAQTVSSETIALATFDSTLQTGMLLMVY